MRDWCFYCFYGEIGDFWLEIDRFDGFCVVLLLEVSVLRSFRSGKLRFGMVLELLGLISLDCCNFFLKKIGVFEEEDLFN